MTETLLLLVEEGEGERLDKWLADRTDLTRSALQGLTEEGRITLGRQPLNKKYKVRLGDAIEVALPPPRPCRAEAEDIPLEIVYEDESLLVVNKPKGMVVHPAEGHPSGTLVNALLYHCGDSLSGINGVMRPGILHRIDKDTSGLLVVAKGDEAHRCLAEQIKEHSFLREYQCVAQGRFREPDGTVNLPVGRHPVHRKKMAVTDKNSRNAVTHYRLLTQYDGFSHLSCRLETGRTHQIRVHLSALGHPLAGDVLYGGKPCRGFEGQCLHAKKIGFVHPVTGEYMEFDSPLPPWFEDLLSRLWGGESRQ